MKILKYPIFILNFWYSPKFPVQTHFFLKLVTLQWWLISPINTASKFTKNFCILHPISALYTSLPFLMRLISDLGPHYEPSIYCLMQHPSDLRTSFCFCWIIIWAKHNKPNTHLTIAPFFLLVHLFKSFISFSSFYFND